ncbi:MAG: methyltransferase domain-containing protein [Pseudonocardiaceae bacterium]|nr:methyltransferase domain-containing protein [Pseudonocardiaceae bacterium]
MEAVYTHGHHDSVLRSHRWRTVRNSAGYLIEHLRSGAAVLDVGCGPGTITVDLAERVAPGLVTAVDAAGDVVAQAEQEAVERGVRNVRFAVADLYALEYTDSSFDIVHAHQVLQHVADPVLALREMRRVAKPGGIVAARDADYAGMTWYPTAPGMDQWLSVYRAVARANGGEPDAGRRLLSWARQAGFEEITSSASVWCYATADERAWWSGLWAERVVNSAFAEHALAGGHANADDLRRMSRAWHDWAQAEDGWFSVLNGEILCRA